MNAKERVLKDMADGTPWETLTKNHSKSSLYTAYTDFMPTMEEHLKKMRLEIANLEKEREGTQRQATLFHDERGQALSERDEARQEKELAIGRLEEVREELDTASQELTNIQAGLDRLSERNISEDLVSNLSAMDVMDDKDLLARVSTADRFHQLSEDVEQMEDKLERRALAELLRLDSLPISYMPSRGEEPLL
jgi:uncharacterized protein (DUF3084 family)